MKRQVTYGIVIVLAAFVFIAIGASLNSNPTTGNAILDRLFPDGSDNAQPVQSEMTEEVPAEITPSTTLGEINGNTPLGELCARINQQGNTPSRQEFDVCFTNYEFCTESVANLNLDDEEMETNLFKGCYNELRRCRGLPMEPRA